jgi:hypothetical protein
MGIGFLVMNIGMQDHHHRRINGSLAHLIWDSVWVLQTQTIPLVKHQSRGFSMLQTTSTGMHRMDIGTPGHHHLRINGRS